MRKMYGYLKKAYQIENVRIFKTFLAPGLHYNAWHKVSVTGTHKILANVWSHQQFML